MGRRDSRGGASAATVVKQETLSARDEALLAELHATFFSPVGVERVKARASKVVPGPREMRLRARPGDQTDATYPGNVMASVTELLASGRKAEALVMLKSACDFDAGGAARGQDEPSGDYVGKKRFVVAGVSCAGCESRQAAARGCRRRGRSCRRSGRGRGKAQSSVKAHQS